MSETISPADDDDQDIKQAEDLMVLGGIFYQLGEESWCDTPMSSWKLVPGVGYRRYPEAP